MWVNASVLISTPEATPHERASLEAAMDRRGWEHVGEQHYATSFLDPVSDMSVVNRIEQDVKQAVYVAGIRIYDAICLLSDPQLLEDGDGDLDECDGDLNNTAME